MQGLIITIGILMVWSLWGFFSSNVEQAEYTVLKRAGGYEIREYPEHIVAQTTVEGSYNEALNDGFSIVARYIFGGNVAREGIAMTAPVTSSSPSSEKIAMTAPVTSRPEGGSRVIAFVMPKSYTLESLPTPTDPRVTLVKEPARRMAVLRFSWWRSSDRIRNMESRLLGLLEKDGVVVIGAPAYAGYNAPWTPPWMSRNEIMIEVR
ncbi:MAG: hypothetical protein JW384_00343 [Nitrosomonadaceae bacterium]|nr:hypothetical protein [Nitrosomonadaceae bacterium]